MSSHRISARIGLAALVVSGSGIVLQATPASALVVDVATEAEYRAALAGASNSEPNVINLTADITLAGAAQPLYVSTQDLTINGNGHTLDGGGNSRVLLIGGGSLADLTVNRLVARNAVAPNDDGGAIQVNGDVTIVESAFFDNSAPDEGGAVHANSSLTAVRSTFAGNRAVASGGALSANNGISLQNSTVTGNEVTGQAGSGGGGLFSRGEIRLVYATISGNASPSFGAANIETFNDLITYGSVIVDPQGTGNCSIDGVISEGFNLSDDTTCDLDAPTDTQGDVDPQLGPLAANGGPTETMRPADGSPLVDAIPEADCRPGVAVDQRGIARPQDGDGDGVPACDIGAVELAGTVTPPTSPTTATTQPSSPTTGPGASTTTTPPTRAVAAVAVTSTPVFTG